MAKTRESGIEDVTIEQHINTHYRDYSYYVLSSRGIPSKYDGLIPVQRLLLLNAPDKLKGTNSLIGETIGSGLYHHGDQSLAGAINRMCRDFDNSFNLLQGDGFFGSGIGSAAASRYTKVRSNPEVAEMIKKYSPVNEYDEEGNCKFINLDVPIGLCTSVVGIAIAYRSQILPRKYEDLKKYIDGDDNTSLKPYFKGFGGKIYRNKKNKNAWIIASNIGYNEKKGEIHIVDLPPMMRYDTFLERLKDIMDKSPCSRMKLFNDSKSFVNIRVKIKNCKKEDIEKIMNKISSISSISVPEDIVFADEDGIVRYNNIREYLDDFKIFRNRSILKKMQWDREELVFEREYNFYKELFIKFMSKKQRTNNEVKHWMEEIPVKENMLDRIRDRLRSIPAYKITREELEEAKENNLRLIREVKVADKNIKKFKEENEFKLTHSKGKSLARTSGN